MLGNSPFEGRESKFSAAGQSWLLGGLPALPPGLSSAPHSCHYDVAVHPRGSECPAGVRADAQVLAAALAPLRSGLYKKEEGGPGCPGSES